MSDVVRLITEPYLLFVCVPIPIDSNGCPHTDQFWAKDLALHLEYIEDLSLACPVLYKPAEPGSTPLWGPPFDRLKIVPLPAPRNRLEALLVLPRVLAAAWCAVGKAQIVHTGLGGWPLTDGWIACPIAKLRGKLLLMNVESSFWRAAPGARWHRRLRGLVGEMVSRWCVRVADLRFFTSAAYLGDLLPAGAAGTRDPRNLDRRRIHTEHARSNRGVGE